MRQYTIEEMKIAFECGRNYQLTGEDNFQELIEKLSQALPKGYDSNNICEHPYASLIGEEHGNTRCLKCGKNLNE